MARRATTYQTIGADDAALKEKLFVNPGTHSTDTRSVGGGGVAGHGDHCPSSPSDAHADDVVAVRGASSIFLFQTVGRLASFGFVLVVTRALAADQFGRYSLAAAVVLMATTIFDLGITPTITQSVSRRPWRSEGLLAATLAGSGVLGLFGFLAVMGFALVAPYTDDTLTDFAIAGLAIPASAMSSSVLAALDGHRLMAQRAAITLVQTAVVTVGGILFVVSGAGVQGALWAVAAGPWVALAMGRRTARRHHVWSGRLTPSPRETMALLRLALPLAIASGLGVLVLRLDIVLLSLLAGPSATATYDVARRLTESVGYVSSAVTVPALVILSSRLSGGGHRGADKVFKEAMRLVTLVGLPLSVALALGAGPIMRVAFGEQFTDARAPVAILGAGVWIMFVTQVQTVVFVAGRRLRQAIALAALNLGVVILLDVVLINRFGPAGAALALTSSSVVVAVAGNRIIRQTFGFTTPVPSPQVLLSAIGMGIAVVLLNDPAGLLALPVGAAVYVLGLFVTGVLDRAECDRLWSLLRGRSKLESRQPDAWDPGVTVVPSSLDTPTSVGARRDE